MVVGRSHLHLDADPRGILAFLAVVEHGTFRAAAKSLNVPPSTVSRWVADLETCLDTRLLARTTRSVTLTDAGALYHHEVLPAVEALHQAETRVAALRDEPRGHLRLTAPFELGQDLFGKVLTDYAARYPDVRVTLDLIDRQVQLVAEGYDLAVRVGPLEDSTLIAKALENPQPMCVFASQRYLQAHGCPSEPEDLKDHRCLVMSGAKAPSTWGFRRGRKRVTMTVVPHYAVNCFSILAELTRQGLGISRMPQRYGCSLNGVVEILPSFTPPARSVYAVYPSRRHVSPALRAMLTHLDGVVLSPRQHP